MSSVDAFERNLAFAQPSRFTFRKAGLAFVLFSLLFGALPLLAETQKKPRLEFLPLASPKINLQEALSPDTPAWQKQRPDSPGYLVRLMPKQDLAALGTLAFYTNSRRAEIHLFFGNKRFWTNKEKYLLFSSAFAPLPEGEKLKELRILVKSEGGDSLPFTIAEKSALEHFLFRRDLLHTMLGAVFLVLGLFLWGMIVARPKERLSVLSFEAFVLLSAVFCLSSSEIIRLLFPLSETWALVATLSYIALPLPILFFCRQAVSKAGSLIFYIFLGLCFSALLFLFFRLATPVWFRRLLFLESATALFYLFFFSFQAFRVKKLSSKIHGLGLSSLAIAGVVDFFNYTQGQSLYAGYLSPFGVLFLSLAILAILEYRFMRTQQEMQKSNEELAAINQSYNRFVPVEFFRFLNKEKITDVHLGDNTECEVTILVTDIHKFTTMSEEMTPVENFDFINSYFSRIGPSIKGNHGFIAKYMGDGVMALFARNPDDALHAASDIHNVLYVYNQSRKTRGREPVGTGIGIHKGVVRLGIVGSETRMQGDLISDTANMAARTEGLTRIYGAKTVISEDVYKDLQESEFVFRVLDLVLLKGKQEPMRFYEMLEPNPDGSPTPKLLTKDLFEEGIRIYLNREFAQAAEIMQEVLAKNPGDLAAKHYFDNAMFYAINGAPEDWTGVTELHRKS